MTSQELMDKLNEWQKWKAKAAYAQARDKAMTKLVDENKQRNALMDQSCREWVERLKMLHAITQTNQAEEIDPYAQAYFSQLASQVTSCSKTTQGYYNNMHENVSKLAEIKQKFDEVQESAEWLAQLRLEQAEVDSIEEQLIESRQRLAEMTSHLEKSIKHLEEFKKYELNNWIVQLCKEALATSKFKKKLAQLLVLNAKLEKEKEDSLDSSINYGEDGQEEPVTSNEEPEIVEAAEVAEIVEVSEDPKPAAPKPITAKPAIQQVASKPVQQVASKPVQQVAQKPMNSKPVQKPVAPKPVQQTQKPVAPKPIVQQAPKPVAPKPIVQQAPKSVAQKPPVQNNQQIAPKPTKPVKKVSFTIEEETSGQALQFNPDESLNGSSLNNSFKFGETTQALPIENDVEMNFVDEQEPEGFNFNFGESGIASPQKSFNFGGNASAMSPFPAKNSIDKRSPEKMSFLNHEEGNMDFNQDMNDSDGSDGSCNLFSGFMGMGDDSKSGGGMNDLFSTSKADEDLENGGGDAMFNFFGNGNDSPTDGDQPEGEIDHFSFNFGDGNDDGSQGNSESLFFK